MMRKKMIGRGLAAVVALGTAIALAGCGSGGTSGAGAVANGSYKGPKVTISFWNGWTGGAATTIVPKLIDEFNSTHKNIVVNNNTITWGDIAAKMPLAIKAGKGPDVAVGHGDDIATYAAQGLLLKADSIVKGLGYTASDFPAGLLADGKYKGSQYGIPWSVTPLGFYANKDVMAKAGITALPTDKASYLAALAALKAKGIQGDWVDGFVFTGTFQWETLLWQNGGSLFNKDLTKATFNSQAGIDALTTMTDLIKNGYSPANVAQDANINALISGKAAFNWNGIWQTTNPALGKVKWEAGAVPQIGPQKAVWSSSTHFYFVNNKGQDKNKTAAAAVFVKWMLAHADGWPATGELPALNSVRNAPALLQNYPNLKPFLDELPYAHYEPVAPGITSVEATFTTAVNNAILGKKTPKEALDAAVAQANQLLAQNKAQYGG